MQRLITVSSFVFAFYLLSSASTFAEDKIAAKTIRPYVILTGAQSHVNERSCFRITSREDWTELWLRHVGKNSQGGYNHYHNQAGIPEIDFDQCMVVAIFQGSCWNSAGLKADSIIEAKDEITFRFDDKCYQTMELGDRVVVYGFFILPRSAKMITLEENVQGIIGNPPVWEKRARFEKLPI